MNKPLNVNTFNEAFISNNIFNASGTELNNLFVDAANGNFKLKSSAINAIDKGISVGIYDTNVEGLPDIGAIEYCSVLPLTLTSFTGKTTSSGNQLKWTTQSESNNEGFGILRSVDGGLNFHRIGFLQSQSSTGNSSITLNYTFLDTDIQAEAFYKLQQNDLNGDVSTPGNVIFLQTDFVVETNVYPNPFTDEININLNAKSKASFTFTLTNASGKLVYNKSEKVQINTRIAMQNQPAGWYILNVYDAEGKLILSRKVIKKGSK